MEVEIKSWLSAEILLLFSTPPPKLVSLFHQGWNAERSLGKGEKDWSASFPLHPKLSSWTLRKNSRMLLFSAVQKWLCYIGAAKNRSRLLLFCAAHASFSCGDEKRFFFSSCHLKLKKWVDSLDYKPRGMIIFYSMQPTLQVGSGKNNLLGKRVENWFSLPPSLNWELGQQRIEAGLFSSSPSSPFVGRGIWSYSQPKLRGGRERRGLFLAPPQAAASAPAAEDRSWFFGCFPQWRDGGKRTILFFPPKSYTSAEAQADNLGWGEDKRNQLGFWCTCCHRPVTASQKGCDASNLPGWEIRRTEHPADPCRHLSVGSWYVPGHTSTFPQKIRRWVLADPSSNIQVLGATGSLFLWIDWKPPNHLWIVWLIPLGV